MSEIAQQRKRFADCRNCAVGTGDGSGTDTDRAARDAEHGRIVDPVAHSGGISGAQEITS